jgi:hypothetical protein
MGSRSRALAMTLRRHMALVLLLATAIALRIVALVAIYPGVWFSDTNSYVRAAATGELSVVRVSGYALVVAPFWHAGSAGALIIVQHVLGVAIAVLLYALLLRRGVSRAVAALAVVPAALDAYLIDIEHMVMSETIFHGALMVAIAFLMWRERLGPVAAVAGGMLVGYAGVVRSVAMPFVAVFVVYLLARRVGWRPLVAFCVGWAVVAGGYATAFKVQHGTFGFTESDGKFLYARVAPFADCSSLHGVSAFERSLCPDPAHRLKTNAYRWGRRSPIHGLPAEVDNQIRDFALRAMADRPLTYARTVVGDFFHYFEPGHRMGGNDYPVSAWQFPADPRRWHYPGYRGPIRPGSAQRLHGIDPSQYITRMTGRPRINVAASSFLSRYQRYAYTSGQVLAACVLLVLVALVRRRGAWRLRLDAALLAAVALVALMVASALSMFDYRYGFLGLLLLPVAAALAGTALFRTADAVAFAATSGHGSE